MGDSAKRHLGVPRPAIVGAAAAELLRILGFYWLVLHLTALPWLYGEASRQLVILAFGVTNLTLPLVLVLVAWLARGSVERGNSQGTFVNVLRLMKFVGIFVLLAAATTALGQRTPVVPLAAGLFAAILGFDLISLRVLLSLEVRSATPGAADREENDPVGPPS